MTSKLEAQIGTREISTFSIRRNPHNPRLFFNEESLDLLKTSIQEVGILVPLIVYADSAKPGEYVLLDGERRWRCALDIGLDVVPANVVPEPTPLDNILRMFNIHSVREDWPLISTALSLQDVITYTGETRETRLAEMTGLTRSTVRRSKRLLTLPTTEIDLMRAEAHLSRNDQVHREDLYIEIIAAESVLRNTFPEIASEFSREQIIRQFARKREEGNLVGVTEFRVISRIVDAASAGIVPYNDIVIAVRELVNKPNLNPTQVFEDLLADSYRQSSVAQKSASLTEELSGLLSVSMLSDDLIRSLNELQDIIRRVLADR